MKGGGHGHAMSGSRGNKKIGIKKDYGTPVQNKGTVKAHSSPKSATEFNCGCSGVKTGQPNS